MLEQRGSIGKSPKLERIRKLLGGNEDVLTRELSEFRNNEQLFLLRTPSVL
jgi:hypothetical protein